MTKQNRRILFRVEKIQSDAIEVTKDDGSTFMYTGKDYAETERVLRLFQWLGVPADNTWTETCRRESELESKRIFEK